MLRSDTLIDRPCITAFQPAASILWRQIKHGLLQRCISDRNPLRIRAWNHRKAFVPQIFFRGRLIRENGTIRCIQNFVHIAPQTQSVTVQFGQACKW